MSTLKRTAAGFDGPQAAASSFGIEHGTFKWNEVEEAKDQNTDTASEATATNGAHVNEGTSMSGEDDAITAVDSASEIVPEEVERRFELTDITVTFPEGALTVVTGPTASGKTALLVSSHPALHCSPK